MAEPNTEQDWDEAIGEELWDAYGNMLGTVKEVIWIENSDKRLFQALLLDNGAEIDVTYMKVEA